MQVCFLYRKYIYIKRSFYGKVLLHGHRDRGYLEECVVFSKEPIVVEAIADAITYTVKFVDFDKNETTVTYTVETKDKFALPSVPAAPEHYENARWNKTVEECVVFSKDVIVVEALADAMSYKVVFDTNGAEPMEAAMVTYNQIGRAHV